MASLDEIETRRNGNDSARIEELIDVFKWPDGKWVQVRLMDRGLLPISTHWVPIIGSKTGKESKIPRLCLNIDPTSGKALKGKAAHMTRAALYVFCKHGQLKLLFLNKGKTMGKEGWERHGIPLAIF